MAATFARVGSPPYRIVAGKKRTTTDMTLDADYADGGEPFSASDLGLYSIDQILSATFKTVANADDGITTLAISQSSATAGKVVLYDDTAALTADDDVSGTAVRIIAEGS